MKDTVAGDEPAPVQQARTRARRRLLGAVVLLAVGVVGFPLVFETRPRPVALDTPIQIAARPASAAASAPATPAREAAPPPAPVETEAAELAPPPSSPSPPSAPTIAAAPARAAASAPARPGASAPADDGARARALLDGASAPTAARFIVQAGAYTDAAVLRDARARIEKLGLKTYTQVAEIDGAKRTRVRTGPYATREEADAAVAKLKAGGIASQVLVL